jgi:hypothetical protein
MAKKSSLLTPYEAEKRGKTGKEDILTSRLLGHISHLDNEIQKEFFERIGLKIGSVKKIELWKVIEEKSMGVRELDGFIETEDGVVVVENKFQTDFTVEQLVDEYNLAKKRSDNVKLLCLSTHLVKPKEIEEAEKALGIKISWASWRQCLDVIKMLAQKSSLSVQTQQNLADLITFMESQGLEPLRGFSFDDSWEVFFRMYENCRLLWNHVRSILQNVGFKPEHEEQDYPFDYSRRKLPYWGRFYYRYLSAEDRKNETNDFGYLMDIGIFEGKTQLRFAVYVPTSLKKQGTIPDYYEVTEEGPPEYKQDYTFYSRCIPIGDLKSPLLEDQMKEIAEFIKRCVAETKPIFP